MGEVMEKKLYCDDVIIRYERSGEWDKCVAYLEEKFSSNPKDKSVLCRLAAQSWYVLSFWHCCMPKEYLDRTLFEKSLKNVFVVAMQDWGDESDILWLFGYFMCINPLDFSFISADVIEVENRGSELVRKAYINDPKNPLAEILFLSECENKWEYNIAKKNMKNEIEEYFSSQSEIDQYFMEIFTTIY